MNKEKIMEFLQDKGADFSSVFEEMIVGIRIITVGVSWGDWKHSHNYLDYVMRQQGFLLLRERVTESDGSDCYSSEHAFYPKEDEEKVNMLRKMFTRKEGA